MHGLSCYKICYVISSSFFKSRVLGRTATAADGYGDPLVRVRRGAAECGVGSRTLGGIEITRPSRTNDDPHTLRGLSHNLWRPRIVARGPSREALADLARPLPNTNGTRLLFDVAHAASRRGAVVRALGDSYYSHAWWGGVGWA